MADAGRLNERTRFMRYLILQVHGNGYDYHRVAVPLSVFEQRLAS